MGQLWTNEMEEHWQAIFEEAANPKDFLIAHDINMNDRLRGLARYTVAAITYWTLGGDKPLSLRLEMESANIDRQIGRAQRAEAAAWLAEPLDSFEDVDWYDA